GVVALAGVAVDQRPAHAVGQVGGKEHQVDAHPLVVGEVAGPVVPPAVEALDALVALAEHVPQAVRLQLVDRGALLGGDVGVAHEGRGAPHVDVRTRHVEVAAHRHGPGLLPRPVGVGLQVVPQAGQPAQLVAELLVAHRPAVGHVDRGHPHAPALVRHQPGVVVGRLPVGEAGHRVVEPDPAQDRHPVPAALTVVDAGVAAGVEHEGGEAIVARLGLLEAQDVGLGDVEPADDALHALDGERVHVPGGDAHGDATYRRGQAPAASPAGSPAAPAPGPPPGFAVALRARDLRTGASTTGSGALAAAFAVALRARDFRTGASACSAGAAFAVAFRDRDLRPGASAASGAGSTALAASFPD